MGGDKGTTILSMYIGTVLKGLISKTLYSKVETDNAIFKDLCKLCTAIISTTVRRFQVVSGASTGSIQMHF